MSTLIYIKKKKKVINSKDPYYFFEKTDGIRYFLFFSKEGSFFVDRKMQFHLIKDLKNSISFMSTIIDGEIVFDIILKEKIFMVFDIIQLNKKTLMNENLGSRIESIKQFFNLYKENQGSFPFKIKMKNFFLGDQFLTFSNSFHKCENGECIFEYQGRFLTISFSSF